MAMTRDDAVNAIMDLVRRKESGEITEEEFREQSIPFAFVVDQALKVESIQIRRTLLSVVEMAESNPRIIEAISVGVVAALGHYLRSESGGD